MLLSLNNIKLAFGNPPLFENVKLQIEKGDRICIVGRNGSGKSTLMKIMVKQMIPDEGEILSSKKLVISYLPQEVPKNLTGTVLNTVLEMMGNIGKLIIEYTKFEKDIQITNETILEKLAKINETTELSGIYEIIAETESIIEKLKLNPNDKVENLSGGQKRRVLLAGAIAGKPDILMLDEPTNHLDTQTIEWLETFLLRRQHAVVFVTHDRAFLQNVANKIVEIDRGQLIDWNCNYTTWIKRKEEFLETEATQNHNFDKKLAKEEAWLRQGVKARRTRNEGRVRALMKLREERKKRRNIEGTAKINITNGERSSKIVIETHNLTFKYKTGQILVKDLNIRIARGDKVGIIGPNGCGKTTLIKLLLKQLQPTSGKVKLGINLQIVYFDQLREKLDENKTVKENLTDKEDSVIVNGKIKHVYAYLKEFLFSPERANTPVSVLSGGERNRLLLAKLFTKPANLLIMDEPTNDLDVETLELLEDILVNYQGSLILVSHDRAFLNNVVTSTLAFEGNGQIGEYVGGYDDWLYQRKNQNAEKPKKIKKEKPKKERPRKLTYKEQKELDALPTIIEKLEQQKEEIHNKLSDPEFYKKFTNQAPELNKKLQQLETELDTKYERWTLLEDLTESIKNNL